MLRPEALVILLRSFGRGAQERRSFPADKAPYILGELIVEGASGKADLKGVAAASSPRVPDPQFSLFRIGTLTRFRNGEPQLWFCA